VRPQPIFVWLTKRGLRLSQNLLYTQEERCLYRGPPREEEIFSFLGKRAPCPPRHGVRQKLCAQRSFICRQQKGEHLNFGVKIAQGPPRGNPKGFWVFNKMLSPREASSNCPNIWEKIGHRFPVRILWTPLNPSSGKFPPKAPFGKFWGPRFFWGGFQFGGLIGLKKIWGEAKFPKMYFGLKPKRFKFFEIPGVWRKRKGWKLRELRQN